MVPQKVQWRNISNFLLALLVVIIPLLGFPVAIRTGLLVLVGLGLAVLTIKEWQYVEHLFSWTGQETEAVTETVVTATTEAKPKRHRVARSRPSIKKEEVVEPEFLSSELVVSEIFHEAPDEVAV